MEPPALYRTFQAARILGVAPWDLEEQPEFWTSWALMFAEVEAEVRPILQERAELRAKAKKK